MWQQNDFFCFKLGMGGGAGRERGREGGREGGKEGGREGGDGDGHVEARNDSKILID